jgi:hypothetical protein
MLLIYLNMKFWLVTANTKYWNTITFPKIYYLSLHCDFIIHSGDETKVK